MASGGRQRLCSPAAMLRRILEGRFGSRSFTNARGASGVASLGNAGRRWSGHGELELAGNGGRRAKGKRRGMRVFGLGLLFVGLEAFEVKRRGSRGGRFGAGSLSGVATVSGRRGAWRGRRGSSGRPRGRVSA